MEPPSSEHVTIINESDRRVRTSSLKRAMSSVLRQHGRQEAQVCLLLTDDDSIRRLNREFRHLDESTDVLTFPAADLPGAPLGDVAISVPYAERQAAVRGVSLTEELGFLAIHGALHLVGFDDESEQDRLQMVDQMNRAAEEAGLRPDYEWASLLHGESAS